MMTRMGTLGRTALALPLLGLVFGCAPDNSPTSTPAPAASPTPIASAPAGWQMVWSDEFAGATIDRARWGFEEDCWGGGNEERQCYTARAANASVQDGNLVITARQEEFTGPALPLSQRPAGSIASETATKPYTSARLTTRGLAAWQYGRIEVRARLPQGQGTWPAIWMLPERDSYGTWAASGEIDIMEAVNLGVACAACPGGRENNILGTLHFGGPWPNNLLASTEAPFPEVLSGFHTYGIIWEPGRFRWTVNGRVFAERRSGDWSTTGSTDQNAPFNRPFHLILNLAIGGRLPEGRGIGGVSAEGFPKQMEVDWVRVWQCQSSCDIAAAQDSAGE